MEQVYNTLTKVIKENEKIVIMTHKNPDFDGMGSAIVLQQIIHEFKKESFICKNSHENNTGLLKAYEYIKKDNVYFNTLNKSETLEYVDSDTLLIILDVHKSNMLEIPEIIDKTNKIILIDHHIQSKECINSSYTYINSNLSSIIEFISGYLKYLNKTISPLLATFMQVGLEIDTNSFKLKTTDKTFETAAFLTKMGANSVIKQELLQENKDEYIKKQRLIEKSFMINNNMAMCIADEQTYENKDLATMALELLQFENVEASFVIGKLEDNLIGVSSRSIGTVDVEKYMSLLGGGGHTNEAATQIKNKTIKEVKELVLNAIGG